MFAEGTGVSRATIVKAEAGIASEETMARLESYLDRLDRERGIDSAKTVPLPVLDISPQLESDLIEIEVTGPSTKLDWRVVFRSHPDHADLITEQAAKLIRDVDSDN